MTYGVDQCRICGVPMPSKGPEAMAEWEQAQRKPTMPEAEWRARGFLAAPTKKQIGIPWLGCCQSCAMKQLNGRFRYNWRGTLMIAVFVLFGVAILGLLIVAPH